MVPVFLVEKPAAGAGTLPNGFVQSRFAAGFSEPTAMAFSPDGRLFVAEQGGKLRVVNKGGGLRTTPFLTVGTDTSGERGLLGIAFDPNFAQNRYVYVYYTATAPNVHNRVSRFTASATDPNVAVRGSEKVVLELNNVGTKTNHNGGAIHFGRDGKLYVATGDNTYSKNAQVLGNLFGKILRINSNGTIPPDNPFYADAGVTGKNKAIWARGLRNPFSFDVQPGTGRIYINDVGAAVWEEINEGRKRANYGWPVHEGPENVTAYNSPTFAYRHGGDIGTTGCAITGGAFYDPATAKFPAGYGGDYLFADFCSGWIRRYDPDRGVEESRLKGPSNERPVDLKVGSDGDLYFLARGTNSIEEIRYVG